LLLAFERGVTTWTLACTTGPAPRPRERSVPARHLAAVRAESARAQPRCGVPEAARVVSGYEAGRDGFGLHRAWVAQGVAPVVVESASLEVTRHDRRAKTARLDVYTRLTRLMRQVAGERKVWRVVHGPSVDAEERRQRHRERLTANRDRPRVINRITGLLASQGLTRPLHGDFLTPLEPRRLWDGAPVPPGLRQRLGREGAQSAGRAHQGAPWEADRRARRRSAEDPARAQGRQRLALKGIGGNSAWVFVLEFFGWRAFRRGQEGGARSGLPPTPPARGTIACAVGLAKAGHRYLRARAIAIAWGWRRFQPERALAQGAQARFGRGRSRLRRIGLVALARTLLSALWRFLDTGALPAGAALNATGRI
jgi:transposase